MVTTAFFASFSTFSFSLSFSAASLSFSFTSTTFAPSTTIASSFCPSFLFASTIL